MAVYPFLLIVSLPNQLLGHINITHISQQLTTLLESVTEDDSVSEDGDDDDDGEVYAVYPCVTRYITELTVLSTCQCGVSEREK